MSDHGECNCDQALALKDRVKVLEAVKRAGTRFGVEAVIIREYLEKALREASPDAYDEYVLAARSGRFQRERDAVLGGQQ